MVSSRRSIYWEAIAGEIGYPPTYVKNRVQQIVDAIVANRARVMAGVTALPGATEGYGVQTAAAVEGNALRMVERLSRRNISGRSSLACLRAPIAGSHRQGDRAVQIC